MFSWFKPKKGRTVFNPSVGPPQGCLVFQVLSHLSVSCLELVHFLVVSRTKRKPPMFVANVCDSFLSDARKPMTVSAKSIPVLIPC